MAIFFCLNPAVIVTSEGFHSAAARFTAGVIGTTVTITHSAGVSLLRVTAAIAYATVLGHVGLGALLCFATVSGSGHGGKGNSDQNLLDEHSRYV